MLNLVFFLENRLLNWKNGISDFFYGKTYFLHCKIIFWCRVLFSTRKTSFSMLNLVFFLENHLSPQEKRDIYFFSIEKLTFYTVKYYFWCRVLFSTRKTSFSMLNLLFFLENHLFHWKIGISNFFYRKTYFLHCEILFFSVWYYFPRGKPRFRC